MVDAWREEGPRDLSGILAAPTQQLQRQLASIGLEYQMQGGETEGVEFDTGRLLDVAVELRSGYSRAKLDVYRSARKTRRDLGIVIGLDISGSTAEAEQGGSPVFEKQLRACYQLARAFTELGDSTEVFGFHSWGKELVRAVHLKSPSEGWSGKVAERMALPEPVGYTRSGAAIRHACHRLKQGHRLPHKLFILITDGISYDQGYEGRYAEADTRVAMSEAAAAGMACVCLCVGGSTSGEKLSEVFGHSNFLAIEEPEQLVGRIRPVVERALAARRLRKY